MQELNKEHEAKQEPWVLADSGTDGLLVQGENVEVLTLVGAAMKERVKCIYMDPPYRNGDDYTHYPDSKSHDQWISYMATLLPSAWDLLSSDGSLWISIDDGEMANLKVLCDAIFGRDSYQATIVWQHRTTRENRAAFSHNHEYVLVYAKNPAVFKRSRNKIPAPDLSSRYKNPDNDPRGPWQSITATAQAGHAVPSQFYSIFSPVTGKENVPPKGRCWVYSEERMLDEIKQGHVWFGSDGNGVPRLKKYLADASAAVVSDTLWTADEVGTTATAKKQLLKMFPGGDADVFDTPKPEQLLARILEIATNPGDIVLDPFLGSGTTAAVAQKMGRRYIGFDESPVSFSFARERLDKVIEGESSGISKQIKWSGGGAYAAYELKMLKLQSVA